MNAQGRRKLSRYTDVPTFANTKLVPWRVMLNKELKERGLAEALSAEARGYYETGYTPELAARDIEVCRQIEAEAR